MKNEKSHRRIQLLKIVYPKLFDLLTKELSIHHIHQFDVQATCQKVDEQVKVQINFGANYSQSISREFLEKELNEKNETFTNFCKEVGETCKEALIADYFKMVKP